jgi:hypothetical protein
MTGRQKKKAHLLHSGVGQLVRVHCPKCGWERDDTNPQWAVKWPGHYYLALFTCEWASCPNLTVFFTPVDWSILRTPNAENIDLDEQGFDDNYAFGSCLRAKDEAPSPSPGAVKCWCYICKKDTKTSSTYSSNQKEYEDHNPRWTLGARPLYVERSSTCFCCGRSNTRFVPTDVNIPVILPQLVKNLGSNHFSLGMRG